MSRMRAVWAGVAAMVLALTGCQATDFDPTAIPAPTPPRKQQLDCNLIFPQPAADPLAP